MRLYLYALSIIALILAGVSPACKFMNGESVMMEICTTDGVERIALNDTPADEDQNHQKQPDCAFCFTQTHLKSFQTAATTIVPPVSITGTDTPALQTQHHAHTRYQTQSPRAPPLQT